MAFGKDASETVERDHVGERASSRVRYHRSVIRFAALAGAVGCGAAVAPTPHVEGGECFGDASYVVRRAYDRTARVIVEHRVSAGMAVDVVEDVVVGAGESPSTFTIRGGPAGTGTLDGPAWAWTGWTGEFHGGDGSTMTTAVSIDDAGMQVIAEIHAGGRHSMGVPERYPRFACSELGKREAALATK